MRDLLVGDAPSLVRWDITDRCNLRCRHCRASDYFEHSEPWAELSTPEALSLINGLTASGVEVLSILGGEPLMRDDLIAILLKAVWEGLAVQVVTNGTLLTREKIQAILGTGVGELCFSLDGACEATNDYIRGRGSFCRTVDAIKETVKIKQLTQARTTLRINTVLTKRNLTEIDQTISLAQQLKVERLLFSVVSKQGSAVRHWRELEPSCDALVEAGYQILARRADSSADLLVEENFVTCKMIDYYNENCGLDLRHRYSHCSAGLRAIFIRADGVVFPCPALADGGAFSHSQLCPDQTHRLPASSLSEICQSLQFRNFRERWSENYVSNYWPCNTCAHFRKYCNPCVLPSMMNKSHLENLCVRAEQLLARRQPQSPS